LLRGKLITLNDKLHIGFITADQLTNWAEHLPLKQWTRVQLKDIEIALGIQH